MEISASDDAAWSPSPGIWSASEVAATGNCRWQEARGATSMRHGELARGHEALDRLDAELPAVGDISLGQQPVVVSASWHPGCLQPRGAATTLASQTCAPCHEGATLLTLERPQVLLADLNDRWQLAQAGRTLNRHVTFKSFARARGRAATHPTSGCSRTMSSPKARPRIAASLTRPAVRRVRIAGSGQPHPRA
jgi:hypothetical protein